MFLNYCIIKRYKIENCFGKLFLSLVSINTIHGRSSQEGEWTKREEKKQSKESKAGQVAAGHSGLSKGEDLNSPLLLILLFLRKKQSQMSPLVNQMFSLIILQEKVI